MRIVKVVGLLLIAVVAAVALYLVVAVLVYPPEYVYRVFAWRESDAFDWQKFPAHELQAAPKPYQFENAPDPRVEELFEELSGAPDWNAFLAENDTQAFIVVQDGKVLYENYFNDTRRDSIVTSFSVAKSFASALIGIAIEEGYIRSVDDPITTYLPELAERDERFNEVTLRHLLMMASGLEYEEFRPLLLNGDDPLTTYYPDQRQIALENTRIISPPGQYFRYNKYHPQLLGMVLERATGRSVSDYMQEKLWNPLGMEFSGSWSTDSKDSDFEKMESGVNARAIDFTKFGMLFLNDGLWQGTQVIPKQWVKESTGPQIPYNDSYYTEWFATLPGKAYYSYMWWGAEREDGSYDFAAKGDKGQYIYVSPSKRLVIVRNGIDYGIPAEEWNRLFYEFAGRW